MIDRNIYINLEIWKDSKNRKPLILRWARQVWKSFAVEEFAKKNFKKLHKINFQSNKKAFLIFDWDLETNEIIKKLEYILNTDININTDLLFFDEIQECPNAINSLKFFCEDLPELAIISAGSYLWFVKNESSFPVWKVEYLSMFPLTFEEFLKAINKRLFDFYQNINIWEVIDELIHKELLKTFYLYLAVWWMPEVVQIYIDLWSNPSVENLNKIRKIQNNLLESYKSDFSKHAWVVNSNHILSVYESISSQLSKSFDNEVDKFKFSWVISNQKWYDRIIWPLTWLSKARLVIKNFIISGIETPLRSNIINNRFKVFFHDIWLLNASLNTQMSSIMDSMNIWYYKWYIVENFVAIELYAIFDMDINSWEKWQSEIEFLLEYNNNVIPLEVKSSSKSRKAKSLDSYVKRYNPKFAYKLSTQNYGFNKDKGYYTLPLYMIWKVFISK